VTLVTELPDRTGGPAQRRDGAKRRVRLRVGLSRWLGGQPPDVRYPIRALPPTPARQRHLRRSAATMYQSPADCVM